MSTVQPSRRANNIFAVGEISSLSPVNPDASDKALGHINSQSLLQILVQGIHC
jgi:hypothetical protein